MKIYSFDYVDKKFKEFKKPTWLRAGDELNICGCCGAQWVDKYTKNTKNRGITMSPGGTEVLNFVEGKEEVVTVTTKNGDIQLHVRTTW